MNRALLLMSIGLLQACTSGNELHNDESARLPLLVAMPLESGQVITFRSPASSIDKIKRHAAIIRNKNEFLEGLSIHEGIALVVLDAGSNGVSAQQLFTDVILHYPVFAAKFKKVSVGPACDHKLWLEEALSRGLFLDAFTGGLGRAPRLGGASRPPTPEKIRTTTRIGVKVISDKELAIQIKSPGVADRTMIVHSDDPNYITSATPAGQFVYVYVLSDASLMHTARAVLARLHETNNVIFSYLFEIYSAPTVDFSGVTNQFIDMLSLRFPYGIRFVNGSSYNRMRE